MVSHRDGRKKLEPTIEQNRFGAVLIVSRDEKVEITFTG
jgi:hypothetical protein